MSNAECGPCEHATHVCFDGSDDPMVPGHLRCEKHCECRTVGGVIDEVVSEQVARDGHAEISFWAAKPNVFPGVFSLVMSDGGGYSSVLMTTKCWREMKAKVDVLIEKHVEGQPVDGVTGISEALLERALAQVNDVFRKDP